MATVQEILQAKGPRVVTVSAQDTVLDAARRMNDARIGAVVVCDRTRGVAGIFSERDILVRIVGEGRPAGTTRVEEVMSTPVTCCTPATSLEECRSVMTMRRLRHLPVVENEELVGIISIGDLMAHEVQLQQSTIEYLNEYLLGRT